MKKQAVWLVLALSLLLDSVAQSATLLPNGRQVFVDQNGQPLAGGTVSFYVPNTLTPKTTWKDSGQATVNTNPVLLDSSGSAVIYGSGTYRQVLKDVFGQVIWDQPTADTTASGSVSWGGLAGGTGNAITLTTTGFTGLSGQVVYFKVTSTNSGPVTATVNGTAYSVSKDTLVGPIALTGGELTVNNLAGLLFDGTLFHLIEGMTVRPFVSVASAATTDLGALGSTNVTVSGTAAITSLGSSALLTNPVYQLVFTGAASLVYDGTALITPTGQTLVMKAGASAVVQALGSGNWRVLSYTLPTSWPTRQTLTSGSGATYTTPAGATRLFVRMLGGGGGGGGDGTASATNGGVGGTTSFGAFTAVGGSGGVATNNAFGAPGGVGGTGGAGAALLRRQGTYGSAGAANAGGGVSAIGGAGGNTWLGGGGVTEPSNTAAYLAGRANTGSGAAGAANGNTNIGAGGGGGAGEYVEVSVTNPAATYTYTIGAGGTAGAAGTSGAAGGVGGSGVVLVDEYYGMD